MKITKYFTAAILGALIFPPFVGLALAQGLTIPPPSLDLFSLSGIGALIGVGVHWGSTRRQIHQIELELTQKADKDTMNTHIQYIGEKLGHIEDLLERRQNPRP